MNTSSFRKSKLTLLLLAALGGSAVSVSANATQTLLSYDSYGQVYGYINVQTPASMFFPNGSSWTGYGNSDYNNSNGIANASWSLPAGLSTSDLSYNAATDSGTYGYGYTGSAQVLGNKLKASLSTSSTDTGGNNPNSTSIQAYAIASYNDQWLISANSSHAAGTYGAFQITTTLDGKFPTAPGDSNNAYIYLQSSTNFSDLSGVYYQSSSYISANPTGSSTSTNNSYVPADWSTTQSVSITKKYLFQYGTAFNFNMNLQAYSSGNGEADFFNTGKITDIYLPFGASLETGAGDSGVSGVTFGNVHNALTLADPNTNWVFGSNDGGAIVPVPEPETYAMMLAGLGLMGYMVKKRKRA